MHKQRNVLNAIPRRERGDVQVELLRIWEQLTKQEALIQLAAFKAKYSKRYAEAVHSLAEQASRGRERSGLAPDVWVDEPAEGTLRYVAQRTTLGNFAYLLYTLAVQQGLERAKQVVVLGDGALWIWRLVEEHFPGAVQIVDLWHAASACVGGGAGGLWAQYPRWHCLGQARLFVARSRRD